MIKEGYKETEIGALPSDWAVQPIEFVYDILDSQRIPVNETERRNRAGDIPYYGANGIVGYIDDYIFNDDLILVAEDGGNFEDFHIRPVAYVVRGKTWVNNHAHVLKPRVGNDFMWMFYVLQHKDMTPFIKGGTRSKLNQQDLRRILVQLPPLSEQQKIAEILSTVDEHIGETEDLIEKTKTLKQGMMQRLLTKGIGHTEFKETEIGRIPASWEIVRLEQVAKIIMGQSPNSGSYNTTERGLPFYQGKADFGDKYPFTRVWCSEPVKIAPPDSILISVRAPVGAINLSLAKSCIGRGLAAIAVEDLRTRTYLYFYLQLFASRFEKVSQGSTFTAINSGDLNGFLVPSPYLVEQEKISSILTEIDDQADAYKSKLDALVRLKSGLMQKLLTGKIRVKV